MVIKKECIQNRIFIEFIFESFLFEVDLCIESFVGLLNQSKVLIYEMCAYLFTYVRMTWKSWLETAMFHVLLAC